MERSFLWSLSKLNDGQRLSALLSDVLATSAMAEEAIPNAIREAKMGMTYVREKDAKSEEVVKQPRDSSRDCSRRHARLQLDCLPVLSTLCPSVEFSNVRKSSNLGAPLDVAAALRIATLPRVKKTSRDPTTEDTIKGRVLQCRRMLMQRGRCPLEEFGKFLPHHDPQIGSQAIGR